MFTSLKNKIKEETGSDLPTSSLGAHHWTGNNKARTRNRYPSTVSVNSVDDGLAESQPHLDQLSHLRGQCNELTTKVTELTGRLETMQEEKGRMEKTNEILLETVKVAQTQKDIYCEEQEKIQNFQQTEIDKLKSLLSFREQEAIDRLTTLRQTQQHVENLTVELERIKKIEPLVESLQDELESLRHSSQLGKNNLTTTLAAVEEENCHLKMRLHIMEQTRLDTITTLDKEEKIQALVEERKLLGQHLEEAHLQLSDIKSSWSGQNLALETQVSRLSKQVAEEATEKRRALKMCDEMAEKVKNMELETMKRMEELNQRNDKIKLLAEEIHELNAMLKGSREDADQQILFERNKVETLEKESHELRQNLEEANNRLRDYVGDSERVAQELREQNSQMLQQLKETQEKFECERDEKLTALLKNAEISQSEELLRKELRVERDEANELHEKYQRLLDELQKREEEVSKSVVVVNELKAVIERYEEQLKTVEEMQRELNEKSKTIKVLNQRLNDIKKTLQKEFRNAKSFEDVALNAEKTLENGFAPPAMTLPLGNASSCCVRSREVNHSGTTVVMDEVNFKYLKHVIVKFLTSRELEARHLIRAVATLLQLSKEEEKLLQDTLNWKMSWFGSKPNHGSGQRAFSIPPS